MYYNTHISSLDIIDYNLYLEIEKVYNKLISVNSLIYNKLNFIKYSLNLDSQYIIPSYNTLDNSLYFGYVLTENVQCYLMKMDIL